MTVAARRGDRGAAVVDFVLVGALVVVLALGVVQLTLAIHVRNTLVDCAAEGARYGALDGHDTGDAADRAQDLVRQALASSYAQDVVAARVVRGGVELVEVTISAPLPVIGLVGPAGSLTVTGHAIAEDALP